MLVHVNFSTILIPLLRNLPAGGQGGGRQGEVILFDGFI